MKRFFAFLVLLSAPLFFLGCSDDDDGNDNSSARTVVILGDSITSDENYPGVAPWPSELQGMRPEWTVINAAAGNDRAADARRKVGGQLSRHSPQVLVVMVGSVNAIHGDLGSYESDLRAIASAGKAAGAKVLFCTIPPMVGPRAGWSSSVNRVNDRVRAAAQAEGVGVVDIYGEFGGSGADPAGFPNGLHPLADGQRIIAVAVREKI